MPVLEQSAADDAADAAGTQDYESHVLKLRTAAAASFAAITMQVCRRGSGGYGLVMNITRNDDGTLIVPIIPGRHDDELGVTADDAPTTRLLHPGEGGYIEALAQWDLQQVGSHAATSTASGRDEAMAVVHAVAEDPEHDVAKAVDSLNDPESSAEALRHVLVGGAPSVKGFAAEVAEAEGGDPIPPHTVTKIIGEVLAEVDS